MSTIKGIFEPFYEYVQDQLETRKKIIGSAKRDSKFFKVYTERQCVIRMASGVDLRLDNDILEPGEEYLTQKNVKGSYSGLARQYILEGGTQFYNLGGGFGGTREGFTQKRNTPKTGHSYGDRNVRANAQDGFGIVPMPGILNAEVTTKSQEGSLREARITYVCFNKRQLEVLEALYMRPGYPVLLEWGWVPYINNDNKVENEMPGFFTEFWDPTSNLDDINKAIRKQKKDTGGNYDGFIGYIKNFTFKVRADGGYDCITELIAQGELLESLQASSALVPSIATYEDVSSVSDRDWIRNQKIYNPDYNKDSRSNNFTEGYRQTPGFTPLGDEPQPIDYTLYETYTDENGELKVRLKENLNKGDSRTIGVTMEPVDKFLYYLRSIKTNLDRAGDAIKLSFQGTDSNYKKVRYLRWSYSIMRGKYDKNHEPTRQLNYKMRKRGDRPNHNSEYITTVWSDWLPEGIPKSVHINQLWTKAQPYNTKKQRTDNDGKYAYTKENVKKHAIGIDLGEADGHVSIGAGAWYGASNTSINAFMLNKGAYEMYPKETSQYVDEKGREINTINLNKIGVNYAKGFEEIRDLVADVAKVPKSDLDFDSELFKGNWDSYVNTSAKPHDDRKTTPYRGTGETDLGELDFGIKSAFSIGFYSMLENTILKEIVSEGRVYEETDKRESVLTNTGLNKRIFVRWDLICQILNQYVFPTYKNKTPITELSYLLSNQPTYSPEISETKLNNLEIDKEFPEGYNYIRYSAPEVVSGGGIFPLYEDSKTVYPPMLGASYDFSICIMPHQWPHLRKPQRPDTSGKSRKDDPLSTNLNETGKALNIERGIDLNNTNFTSFEHVETNTGQLSKVIKKSEFDKDGTKNRKVVSDDKKVIAKDDHCIGLVYFNLDHLIKTYEKLALEEYKTTIDGEIKYRTRVKKKFSLHDWITTIWNDVNDACGGYYDFALHVEHERPNVARMVDFTVSGIPERKLFQFNPQGKDSIARDSFFQSKLDNDFASAISIAAQAPDDIDSLEAVSFGAFHKNIKNRFTSPELDPEDRAREIKQAAQEYQADLKAFNNAVDSLGFYLKKLETSNYNSELRVDTQASITYNRAPISSDSAKALAKNIENQRIKLLARHPARDVGGELNDGKDGRFYVGQYRKGAKHHRNAIIPLTTTMELDGIGGLVPLQIFQINPDKLPKGYQDKDIVFVIKNETNKITAGQDWTTSITGYLTFLSDNSNFGYNTEELENANNDLLDLDINFAEELRAITNEYGHFEKGNEIDSSGNDIDEVVFRFMLDLYKEINAIYDAQHPDYPNESKYYYDIDEDSGRIRQGEPPQVLLITAGNDKFHAEGGGHAETKHKDGLAIDFRLIWADKRATEVSYLFDDYLGGDYSGTYPERPEDNYTSRRYMDDLAFSQLLSVGDWQKLVGTEELPSLGKDIKLSRGAIMHDLLRRLQTKYSPYGMNFTDHYQELEYWPTAQHFHVQFNVSAEDKPFDYPIEDIDRTPLEYSY